MNLYDFQAIGDTRNAQAVEEFYGDEESRDFVQEAEDEFSCLSGDELSVYSTECVGETHNADLLVALRQCQDQLPVAVSLAWMKWRMVAESIIRERIEEEAK